VTADLLVVPPGWRRAAPWLPALMREGRVFVGPDGLTLRVVDGELELLVSGGRPWFRSIAADPTSGR